MAHFEKVEAWYTIDEAALRLRKSRATLDRWAEDAEAAGDPSLAPYRYQLLPGSDWRYPKKRLERWIKDSPSRCAAIKARDKREGEPCLPTN